MANTNRSWGGRVMVGCLVMLGLTASTALAGPPYQTDDPDVIPYMNFEFYTFAAVSSSPGQVGTAGPALEFNWSGVHNVMFHFVMPAATAIPSDGPTTFGLGDSEIGIQYQFVHEGKRRPMIGTFVMFEVPTGNADRGLGAGALSVKVPIWMQKTFKGWTATWGGGEVFSRAAGSRNYPWSGTLLQHDIGKQLTLGGELFTHGREDTDPSTRYAAMLDFGGAYTFTPRHPGFQLLFAYGHTVAGQTENYGYLSLYWTWGRHDDSSS